MLSIVGKTILNPNTSLIGSDHINIIEGSKDPNNQNDKECYLTDTSLFFRYSAKGKNYSKAYPYAWFGTFGSAILSYRLESIDNKDGYFLVGTKKQDIKLGDSILLKISLQTLFA